MLKALAFATSDFISRALDKDKKIMLMKTKTLSFCKHRF